MKEYFIKLFNYNRWADEEALESILNADNVDEQAIRLFSHILASQKIWLGRIMNERDNVISPWEVFTAEDCLSISRQISGNWIDFIKSSSEEDLSRQIEYKNSKGDEYKNKVEDIITHVINHSTYHRGQIAAIVRVSGGTPAVTDYIAYKRTVSSG